MLTGHAAEGSMDKHPCLATRPCLSTFGPGVWLRSHACARVKVTEMSSWLEWSRWEYYTDLQKLDSEIIKHHAWDSVTESHSLPSRLFFLTLRFEVSGRARGLARAGVHAGHVSTTFQNKDTSDTRFCYVCDIQVIRI